MSKTLLVIPLFLLLNCVVMTKQVYHANIQKAFLGGAIYQQKKDQKLFDSLDASIDLIKGAQSAPQ